MAIVRVHNIATTSATIINRRRLNLSTAIPAKVVISTLGNWEKNPTNAKAVAEPVLSHTQIVRANTVIKLPIVDAICPNQMIKKVRMI